MNFNNTKVREKKINVEELIPERKKKRMVESMWGVIVYIILCIFIWIWYFGARNNPALTSTNSMGALFWAISVTMIFSFGAYIFLIKNFLYEGILSSQRIYSLKREQGLVGDFLLGCGHIENVLYFYFYIKESFGMKIQKVRAEDMNIIETDDDHPSLKEILVKGERKHLLIVPKKTIKRDFIA